MIAFLVALRSLEHSEIPQCATDALTCLKRFSGCTVVALTDMNLMDGWSSAKPYMKSANAFKEALMVGLSQPLHRYFPMSARYFIMQEYIDEHGVTESVFNCDWDILVFSDLPEHFKSVGGLETDICSCFVRCSEKAQAPMLISNFAALRRYTDMMRGYLEIEDHNNIFLCDITQWGEVRKAGFTDSLSCADPTKETYFDPNSGIDDDVFEFKDSSKKIVWKDRLPYFIRKENSNVVRAIAIHTFLAWRFRTRELMANV